MLFCVRNNITYNTTRVQLHHRSSLDRNYRRKRYVINFFIFSSSSTLYFFTSNVLPTRSKTRDAGRIFTTNDNLLIKKRDSSDEFASITKGSCNTLHDNNDNGEGEKRVGKYNTTQYYYAQNSISGGGH